LGLLDTIDTVATIAIASSILIGFWEIGGQLGSVSNILAQALTDPQTFGLGTAVFYIAVDTYTPVMPQWFLDQYGLGWLTWFYPFTGGYVPHYSLWTAIFGLIAAFVVTTMFLRFSDHDFLGWGLAVAFASFWIGWYLWTLLAWWMLFQGGAMIGLTAEQVYEIWHSAAVAVESPLLQYFFLGVMALSFPYLIRRIT